MVTDGSAFKEILIILLKHKIKILLVFLATVATVTYLAWSIPPTYEATARLLIKFGREYLYSPEIGDSRRPSNYFNRDGLINMELQILTSRDLAEKVVANIGVDTLYPKKPSTAPGVPGPLERVAAWIGVRVPHPNAKTASDGNRTSFQKAVDRFQGALSATGASASDVIFISFQHGDPVLAERALDELIDFFQEKHIETFSDPNALAYFEGKVATYRQGLSASEEDLETFKRRHAAFSFDEQQRLLLRQRTDLDAALKEAENAVAALGEKGAFLEDQLRQMPENRTLYTETPRTDFIQNAKEQLLELQLKEQALLEKYAPDNRLMLNIRKEIEIVENFVREQESSLQAHVRTGTNELYQSIENDLLQAKAELRSNRSRKDTLKAQIAEVERELKNLVRLEKEFTQIQRELAASEQDFETYRTKLEDYRISNEMDRQKITSIRVIQKATASPDPISPRKRILLAMGMVFGLLFGIGLAFIVEFLSQELNTAETAAKRLDLPVLATVPYKWRYKRIKFT